MRQDATLLLQEKTRLSEENKHLISLVEQRKKEILDVRRELKQEFENFVNKVYETNRTNLSQENKEQVNLLLAPLKEKLQDFQRKVESTNKESVKTHATLLEQIRQLAEMNKTLSDDAKNLTKALKGDSKTQGSW